jgi:hypothetical protein
MTLFLLFAYLLGSIGLVFICFARPETSVAIWMEMSMETANLRRRFAALLLWPGFVILALCTGFVATFSGDGEEFSEYLAAIKEITVCAFGSNSLPTDAAP